MIEVEGKFLGEDISFRVENKAMALNIIGKLGNYFDLFCIYSIMDNEKILIDEEEYMFYIGKWGG